MITLTNGQDTFSIEGNIDSRPTCSSTVTPDVAFVHTAGGGNVPRLGAGMQVAITVEGAVAESTMGVGGSSLADTLKLMLPRVWTVTGALGMEAFNAIIISFTVGTSELTGISAVSLSLQVVD